MSLTGGTRLFDLLPAVHRQRDDEAGGPLRALLSVIEREVVLVEADIAHLYDDWFVETSSEWAVAYIGDLLGVRGLAPLDTDAYTQRAFVANTISYRRRKGTASVLEQLARDITGWPAHAVEYFQRLEWTQYANHIRPDSVRTPDLRDTAHLALFGGPFESASHTAEVRHIDVGRGRYDIPNVGIHLWRVQPYAVELGAARHVGGPNQPRLTFDPVGRDIPLFNTPRTETDATQISREENVAGRLRRRALFDELEARRQSLVDESEAGAVYFRDDAPGPVFEVTLDNDPDPQPPEAVLICDLEDWRRPDKTVLYVPSAGGPPKSRRIRVAVDPVLGRLTYPKGDSHQRARVSFAYGFSADVGGGPYDRRASLMAAQADAEPTWGDDQIVWQMGVSTSVAPVAGVVVSTLGAAVQAWNAQPPGTVGVICVMDSATYHEDLSVATKTVHVPPGSKLLLVAADWPAVPNPAIPGTKHRVVGQYVAAQLRPHLRGDLAVRGLPGGEASVGGLLIVDGLLIEGRCVVRAGDLGDLTISNCTLLPGLDGLVVDAGAGADHANDHLTVRLRRSLCGRIRLADGVPRLRLVDSIVDGRFDQGGASIRAPGTALDVQTSTMVGRVTAKRLDAGNSIFRDRISATRRQSGCVRFCYVTLDSTTPRRYRCAPADDDAARRVVPRFTSTNVADPAYLQLAARTPREISEGAEDEGEMGVFHHLQSGRRVRNLTANLDQYLRFGLEAGIFLAT